MMYLPKATYIATFEIELARTYRRLMNALMDVATSNETVHVYTSDVRIAGTRIRSMQYIGGIWWLQDTSGQRATKLTVENAPTITMGGK